MIRLLCLVACLCWPAFANAGEPVRVFAAASLADVLEDAAGAWSARRSQATPSLAFGASSTLAKQIDAGAPADLYASADASWMDWLEQQGRIEPGTRVELLGNALVLVAPKGRGFALRLERDFDLAAAFAGKLCTGEPGAVPAGTYARQALQHFDWWEALQSRVVGAEDVRTALSFVERGECALGIVYETDARASNKVETLGRFPAGSHAAIVYPFARVRGARAGSDAFLAWLAHDAHARAIFARHGFTVLAR